METLLTASTLNFIPSSLASLDNCEYGLAIIPNELKIVVCGKSDELGLLGFVGEHSEFNQKVLLLGPLCTENAAALRARFEWLKPVLTGLQTSAGMGDRIGVATPGHIRAIRETRGKVIPIFAQQSIREMKRTNRSPQQVMDDATWGIFEEGWQGGFGADADHLKETQDIDTCLSAGFTFFTIDPGDFVEEECESLGMSALREKAGMLPESFQLGCTGLLCKEFDIEDQHIKFDESILLKAMVKYGRAIAHVVAMYEHLVKEAHNRPFELEISMDETAAPTSPAEHIYIASELKRFGVKWVSIAPRFVGRFEKGVDYIGDPMQFDEHVRLHAGIARELGPYKLSLHSGSDKFSIYDSLMDRTHGLCHVKTAGTSYLEALKTIAEVNPDLLRRIYSHARSRFEVDKKSYLSSAELSKAPNTQEVISWREVINQFDAREILHMTYGSILTYKTEDGKKLFYDELTSTLFEHRERYFNHLQNHFYRHLEPFSR